MTEASLVGRTCFQQELFTAKNLSEPITLWDKESYPKDAVGREWGPGKGFRQYNYPPHRKCIQKPVTV
jgi:hypothetical protein